MSQKTWQWHKRFDGRQDWASWQHLVWKVQTVTNEGTWDNMMMALGTLNQDDLA